MEKNSKIIIEYGKDKTGDLYNADNFKYLHEKYGNTMEIVTGDGGFDFSINYDEQENNVLFAIYTNFICLIYKKKMVCYF